MKLTKESLQAFVQHLKQEERSENTIQKYQRDIGAFYDFCRGDVSITKQTVLNYKQHLQQRYAVSSANSMLAAVNTFLKFAGYPELCAKPFKIQRESFRPEDVSLSREEYLRLLYAARGRGQERLCLLMETIASTGIRVSELPFITVEALECGQAIVTLKGKSRTVLLPVELRRKLKTYATEKGIVSGSIFVTAKGRPLDRSNVLRMMKRLANPAGVEEKKIFPHNLRHLFAVTYYQKEHDLAHLADVLGHAHLYARQQRGASTGHQSVGTRAVNTDSRHHEVSGVFVS